MKRNGMLFIRYSILFSALVFAFLSCTKKSSGSNTVTYVLSGDGSGAQEVSAVSTGGTGTITGTLDGNTNVLTYNLTWTNLSGPATAAHIHGPALAGTNANVIIPFTVNNNGTSGSASGSTNITEAQKTDLLAGKWYWNVHTTAHGGGEIRGQISAH
jgi:hypothetical protein